MLRRGSRSPPLRGVCPAPVSLGRWTGQVTHAGSGRGGPGAGDTENFPRLGGKERRAREGKGPMIPGMQRVPFMLTLDPNAPHHLFCEARDGLAACFRHGARARHKCAETRDDPQRIVAARPLCRVQLPFRIQVVCKALRPRASRTRVAWGVGHVFGRGGPPIRNRPRSRAERRRF